MVYSSLLHVYALVETLRERGNDYLDAFWPFLLTAMPSPPHVIDRDAAQKAVLESSGLTMPRVTLETIATRAVRRGLLKKGPRGLQGFMLTDDGVRERDKLQELSSVQREVNELLDDVRSFTASKHGLKWSRQETQERLTQLLARNSNITVAVLEPDDAAALTAPEALEPSDEGALHDYIREAAAARPAAFKMLKDIVFGSLLAGILRTDVLPEFGQRFGRTGLYLDTNVAFGFLGLDQDDANKSALELKELLRTVGAFQLRVFDFTRDELVSVLVGYAKRGQSYLPGRRVRSVYQALKSRGWSSGRVGRYVADIDNHLSAAGIAVEPTARDLYADDACAPDWLETWSSYKPEQGPFGSRHDLYALDEVRTRRKTAPRRLEHCGTLFVSSDSRLLRFDREFLNHAARGTVPEAMLDRALANLLWLKCPDSAKGLSLEAVIALVARPLELTRHGWESFWDKLQALHTEGTLSDSDLALLLVDPCVERDLARHERSKRGPLTAEWVIERLNLAKLAAARREQELAGEAQAQLQVALVEHKQDLEQKADARIEQNTRRFMDRVLQARQTLDRVAREAARRKAHAWAVATDWGRYSIAVALVVSTPWLLHFHERVEPIMPIVGIVLALVTGGSGLKYKCADVEAFLFPRLYNRQLRRGDGVVLKTLDSLLNERNDEQAPSATKTEERPGITTK